MFDLIFDLFFGKRTYKRKPKKKIPKVEALRAKAKEILPDMMKEIAENHGFKYNKLRIKNVKTRWGSCSSKNNINLNLHLANLDKELIEYVIMHELCHTVEKNHSKKFWDLLESHLPDSKMLRKKLKQVKF